MIKKMNKLKIIFLKFVLMIWNLFSSKKVSTLSVEQLNAIFSIRSSRWKKTRDKYLQENPTCAVCGRKENLTIHHIIPVHIDESRELDDKNLITLCQGKTMNCHFIFGHFLNWSKYNPNVVEDSKIWNHKING